MIGECPNCGMSKAKVVMLVEALLEEITRDVPDQARRLEASLNRTLEAMTQAAAVADLASDRILRKLRGPLAKIQRMTR